MDSFIVIGILVLFVVLTKNWKLRFWFGILYGGIGFFLADDGSEKIIASFLAIGSFILLRYFSSAEKREQEAKIKKTQSRH